MAIGDAQRSGWLYVEVRLGELGSFSRSATLAVGGIDFGRRIKGIGVPHPRRGEACDLAW